MSSMMKDEIRSSVNLINELAKLGLPHFIVKEEAVAQYYRERTQQDRIEIGKTDAPPKARIQFVIGKLKSL